MKKLILILFVIASLFGCEEKRKIEIIPDYDMEYLSIAMVDEMAKPDVPTSVSIYDEIISSIHKKETPNKNVLYPVYLRFYINKTGQIDRILVLKHFLEHRYKEEIYKNTRKIVELALPQIENWKFNPAKLSGKNVNMRGDVKLIYKGTKDGLVQLDEEKTEQLFSSDFFNSYSVLVEDMPEPIGGIAAIQKKVRYPEIAKRAGIQGRVYVKAYVDSTGVVTKAILLRGIGAGCDEAAIEAVEKIKFIPGMQNGKAVNVEVTVPILFKLQ
jgi:TonB family protein